MRAVIQRVTAASVVVGDEIVSSIGRGLCVLVGVGRDDGPEDVEYIVRKILNTRIFDGPEGRRWDKSVKESELEILTVSQFTLFGVLKGNKLDFHKSMGPTQAQPFYENFLAQLRTAYKPEKVQDGRFGEMMSVRLENDGPVTISLDSRARDS